MKKDPVAVPDRQKALAMPRRLLKYRATRITPESNNRQTKSKLAVLGFNKCACHANTFRTIM